MLVVFLNSHFVTVKFTKLVENAIESNLGPNYSNVLRVCNSSITIKKILPCTSYQHANKISLVRKMGRIESFFATCFSVKKKVIIWESLELDFILNQSFISAKNMAGSDDELPFHLKTDNDSFEAHRTLHHTDIFDENIDFINYHNRLTTFEIGDGAILKCGAFSFALILGGGLYMFLGQLAV